MVCKSLPKMESTRNVSIARHSLHVTKPFQFYRFDYLKVQPNKFILTKNQCASLAIN